MIDDSSLLDIDIIKKSSRDKKSKEEVREKLSKKNFRDKLYGKINVSVKTMDIVITVLMIALFISVILGIAL